MLEQFILKEVEDKINSLRRSMETISLDSVGMTINFNIAKFGDPYIENFDGILKSVDDALYRAKEAGSNRIELRLIDLCYETVEIN